MGWCDGYNFPLLVPLTSWLPSPRILQQLNIGGFDGIRHITVLPSSQSVLCTYGLSNVILYHVPGRKIVKIFSGKGVNVFSMNMKYEYCISIIYKGKQAVYLIRYFLMRSHL